MSPQSLLALLPLSLLLLQSLLAPSLALLHCRTGVDRVGGALAACAPPLQCMNTTSPRAGTVYSCDRGAICDTILNLRDACVRDGQNTVCCCSTSDGCNYGGGIGASRLAYETVRETKEEAAGTNFLRIVRGGAVAMDSF